MASDKVFIEFITGQMESAGFISHRQMFGEYVIYCNNKVVALVCDNKLFVKPTAGGRAYIGTVVEAPPYPGAKLSFLIGDECEDQEWLSGLIRLTAQELPLPKPKRKKSAKRKPKFQKINDYGA